MKAKLLTFLSISLVALLFTACASVNSSRDDYFGYNNHPKYESDDSQSDDTEEYDWENPLGENYDNRDNFTIVYDNNNVPPSFVPVVVPWYDYPYPWYNTPFSGFYFGVGYYPYPVYNWYSPFYHYNPYGPYAYGGGGYRWYGSDDDGSPNNNVKKHYTIRNFGPNRGTYNSSGKPYAGGSTSSSGRTGGRSRTSSSSNDLPVNTNTTRTKIKYKPVDIDKGSFSGFNSGRSSGRKKVIYDNNTTTKSPSSSGSGLGTSSGGSRPSSGSHSGSGSKSSSSRSSSPRSSGRGK